MNPNRCRRVVTNEETSKPWPGLGLREQGLAGARRLARWCPAWRRHEAIHIYDAGVPLPYIRDILGHVDLSTTEIYARASTETKRRALEAAYVNVVTGDLPEWNQDPGLLNWLAQL